MPSTFYHTKKLITDLALPYGKIDACLNDCMLFWKTHDLDTSCKFCGENRYKSKTSSRKNSSVKVAKKVLCYFPLEPRFQHFYISRHTAKSMVWHSEDRLKDGVFTHPANSSSWKHLNTIHPNFGLDPHNVRLGLASNGFNPFGLMSLSYSTWPVVMSVYNLPLWLCMKAPYLFLSLIIHGLKSPGQDIDVFLEHLVDELNSL